MCVHFISASCKKCLDNKISLCVQRKEDVGQPTPTQQNWRTGISERGENCLQRGYCKTSEHTAHKDTNNYKHWSVYAASSRIHTHALFCWSGECLGQHITLILHHFCCITKVFNDLFSSHIGCNGFILLIGCRVIWCVATHTSEWMQCFHFICNLMMHAVCSSKRRYAHTRLHRVTT